MSTGSAETRVAHHDRTRAEQRNIVTSPPDAILVINAGSSSIRFAVFEASDEPAVLLDGKVDRIGRQGTIMTVKDRSSTALVTRRLVVGTHRTAIASLLDWLEAQPVFAAVVAAGHRVVHGRSRASPARVTPKLLAELRRLSPYAPEHLPREIAIIEAVRKRYPRLTQVACFDTAFHRDMPRVARMIALPRRYAQQGVERYGFHGLSYAYLMEELGRLDPAARKGRVILAHLGTGASMAALRHGQSVDTSMGFTPASGLVMGTRIGDLDPGLAYYLARTERMSTPRLHRMVNQESGLLGVSGTSADMRDLLAIESSDPRAADAIELFCYHARKWIGAYAAALGGLDTLVFAGGIGENAPLVRARICRGLEFLGITLDTRRNARNASLVSRNDAAVTVRVIRTNEELMIARSVARTLAAGPAPARRS